MKLGLEQGALLGAGGGCVDLAGDEEDQRPHEPGQFGAHQAEPVKAQRGDDSHHRVGQHHKDVAGLRHVLSPFSKHPHGRRITARSTASIGWVKTG